MEDAPPQAQPPVAEAALALVGDEEVEELKRGLPRAMGMGGKVPLVRYEGHWYREEGDMLRNALACQRHFRARPTDLVIASMPKTGNTWLKALLYAVVHRGPALAPALGRSHPHELVPFLEGEVYGGGLPSPSPGPRALDALPSPRLLHTHLPYASLPPSVRDDPGCRVVYITRHPLDAAVSHFHFYAALTRMQLAGDDAAVRERVPAVEDYFEDCCRGRTVYGPFLDHVAGYWARARERPDGVLLLRYEDLKRDPAGQVRRLARFVGRGFSGREEEGGVVEGIVELCSFGSLKGMEGNKSGVINKFFEKKSYFRKGEVGDWKLFFTPAMADRMNRLVQEKLHGTGLSFDF